MELTDQEIRDLYDNNPNVTLKQLACYTGKSKSELKAILLSED